MDILAFLAGNLWKKGRILTKETPANPLGDSWHIWNIFGITFEPETLETWSESLKTRILA